MRLFLLARHGRSLLNVEGIVNGDPTRDRGLAPDGKEQARSLAHQIAGVPIDVCVFSSFLRARQTTELALGDRDVPLVVDVELGDIRIGSLEGKTLEDYRLWKHGRTRDDAFPGGGETLNDAARRYADAYERLLARTEAVTLVVCHEIPVRYAINAAAGSRDLDAPVHDVANATPYVFDEGGLRRAVDGIRAAVRPSGRT